MARSVRWTTTTGPVVAAGGEYGSVSNAQKGWRSCRLATMRCMRRSARDSRLTGRPLGSIYYNDLIAESLLPSGDVDERPVEEVQQGDVRNYAQCH